MAARIRVGVCSWADETLTKVWYPKGVTSGEARLRYYADRFDVADMDERARALGQRFPVPKVAGGKPENVIVERSPQQARYMGVQEPVLDEAGAPVVRADGSVVKQWNAGSIIWRMENLPKDPSLDNPLKVTNDARKAGLEFRLIDPAAADFEGSKVNVAVDRVFAIWKDWEERRGTQIVFCDLSTPKARRSTSPAIAEGALPAEGGAAEEDEEVVVSMDDLLTVLARDLSDLAGMIKSQPSHEG